MFDRRLRPLWRSGTPLLLSTPFGLLPVLSKLAERLILSRLNNYLTTNKILISQQHGFRPQLSTSHQLLRVVEYAKSGFKEKKCTGAVFLDIQKAFDRALNRRLISGVWTVNSPQSHIVRVYDAGHGKSGVFHSAEWHDGTYLY
ncbi:putative RNA-directed DNA polymerase from transposon BS [Trichonephila clavipes]|nr:putative RNA-directed DNA polymerase from transposon BS [Trichonephila clavipes]